MLVKLIVDSSSGPSGFLSLQLVCEEVSKLASCLGAKYDLRADFRCKGVVECPVQAFHAFLQRSSAGTEVAQWQIRLGEQVQRLKELDSELLATAVGLPQLKHG